MFFSLLVILASALACGKVMHLTAVQPQSYVLDSGPQDSAVVAMIDPYKAELDTRMNEVIGECGTTLYKDKPEGTLNNWMCDALKAETEAATGRGIDFAAMNYGGIRINELPKGPVTVGKIYELMPFDNTIVILEGDGHLVQAFANRMAASGGWPVSAELRFTIRDTVATVVTVGGRPLELSQPYVFAVPDYVANGGDNFSFLKNASRTDLEDLVRDALITHVRKATSRNEKISAVKDGRIQKK